MPGRKGMVHYPVEIKYEAIRLHEEKGYTYREIAEKLGIRDPERIKVWYRLYRRGGPARLNLHIGRPRKTTISASDYIKHLEMENTLLKKLHSELRSIMLARRNIGSLNSTEENTL
ncbi:MAG: transposase [Anaerolineae bacterium]